MLKNRMVIINIILAICGGITIFFITPWGIGTSPDSAIYIGTADNILRGAGITVPFGEEINGPLSQYPPLYPIILASAGVLFNSPLLAARVINAFVFAANIFLVGMLIDKIRPHHTWLPVAGMMLFLVSQAMVSIHVMAWSEPVFILWCFLSIYLLTLYLSKKSFPILIAAALFSAAAALTRFAGLAIIGTGFCTLIFLQKASYQQRLRDVALYITISLLPITLWLLRGFVVSGTAANREPGVHIINRATLWQGMTTVTSWFSISENYPGWFHAGILVALTILFLSGLWITWKYPAADRDSRQAELPFVFIHIFFIVIYAVFLLLTISFIDANTPLDQRILSPMFISVTVLFLYSLDRIVGLYNNKPILLWTIVLVLVFLNARQLIPNVVAIQSRGIGFSTPAWQNSELISAIRESPSQIEVITNAPEAIYLLAGRPALRIPRPFLLSAQHPNEDFAEEMEVIRQKVRADRAKIVFFTLPGRMSNPTQEELVDLLVLRPEHEFEDGVIYSAANLP